MKHKILCLFFVLCFLLGCQKEESPSQSTATTTPDSQTVFAFVPTIEDAVGDFIAPLNTTVKITMSRQDELDEVMPEVTRIVVQYHQLLDAYHAYRDQDGQIIMNVEQINEYLNTEGKVTVSSEMMMILQEAITMMQITEGAFNPFLGSLIDVWGNRFSNFPVENTDPDATEIDDALSCILTPDNIAEQLLLDATNNTITLNRNDASHKEMKINLGAFAKGYVQDLCKAYLDQTGYTYILDFGTSNVTGYKEEAIRVGIRSPYNKIQALYAIGLEDHLVLSTSGDDNNYFLLKQEDGSTLIRSHILNPATGYSENYYRNVSVLSTSATACDVLSTALFNIKDEAQRKRIVTAFESAYHLSIHYGLMIEDNPQQESIRLLVSEGFYPYILEEYTLSTINNIETE